MDFFLFPHLLHLLIFVLSFLLIFLLFFKYNKSSHPKLPPGKKGWPLIGESIAFAATGRQGHPEKFVNDRMEKYSQDVFRTSLLGGDMAFFCGASGNKFLFTNENKYVRGWYPIAFFDTIKVPVPGGELPFVQELKKYRKILSEFLKPEGLQRIVPVMDSMTKEHLKTDWYPFKQVMVFPIMKKHMFALSCRLFMGIRDPNIVSKLLGPCACILAGIFSMPMNFPGTALNKAMKGSKVVHRELFEIINQRKVELSEMKDITSPDLLTCLLLFKDDDGNSVSDAKIVNRILLTLVAASDSITTTITFALKHLAEHPHVYDRVFKEQMEIAKSKGPNELLNLEDVQKMKYSWSVVCETMRLVPPALGSLREAITNFTFAGYTIPKTWKIFWTVYSTHKNPKYFTDPDKFDPSRFEGNEPAPYTFVPFGAGSHMCPGRDYAKLAILIFMHNVITKFKWTKVIEDEKIMFSPSPSPAKGLPIHLQLH